MPELIINGEIHNDEWNYLVKSDAPGEQEIPVGKVLVPLVTWIAQAETLSQHLTPDLGVWLDSDEEPGDLGNPNQFSVIAINFPKFADGRGYSSARILREKFSFKGELRAMGDVLLDQLFYMKRCGFNSFAMRPDRSAHKALAGLTVFSEAYQGSTDNPLPLFRRR